MKAVTTCKYTQEQKAPGKLVTIRIDPEVHRVARQMGLNISKVCENALLSIVSRFQSPYSNLVGRAGLEPATFCTSSRCPT